MSENKKSGIGAWAVGLFGFLAGLFVGLVILGWWLWPVEWSSGTVEILALEPQEEFLRAAIDSHAYQPDDGLARQRFQALGQNGAYILSTISAEPGAQTATDIEEFAAAVGATDALTNPPAAPAAPFSPELAFGRAISSPLAAGLCAGIVVILAGLLILFLMRRNKKTASAAPSFAPLETEAVSGDTAPVVVAAAAELPAAEQTQALPDWLQESAPEGIDTIELAERGDEEIEGQPREEFDLLGGEAEQSLTDEDIAAITSSRFGESEEEQELPDFLKGAAVAAAGIGVAAAAASTDEEAEAEMTSEAEVGEESLATEEVLATAVATEAAAELESSPAEPETAAAAAEEAAGAIEVVESHEEAHAKFSQDIRSVAGIGPKYADRMRAAGIHAPLLLLRNGATPKGRQQIAEETGISERLILKWVNFVDLFRIKGVNEEYAELLEASGVDTVPELATRNPQNLHNRLLEVIEQKRTFRTPPELWMVEDWVAQAKKLPRAIRY